VGGYAIEPADDVSRSEGVFLTIVYAAAALLLALLGWFLGRRRPWAWPMARALAWLGLVIGGVWTLLSVLVVATMPILERVLPRLASAVTTSPLPPDFATPPLLAGLGFLALRSLRRPEARQWFDVGP
jgi:hypothetical protein